MKPTIFIGSSGKQLPAAGGLQAELHKVAQCRLWTQDQFPPGETTLQSLLKAAERFDFALFVFGRDDVMEKDRERVLVARDNVIFELGLFLGRLPQGRVLFVVPSGRGTKRLHLPSDLAGITHGTYDPDTPKGKWPSAMRGFGRQVKAAIRQFIADPDARVIRGKTVVRELRAIGQGCPEEPTQDMTYETKESILTIRGNNAELSGVVRMRGRIDMLGKVEGRGEVIGGIAYIIYTISDMAPGSGLHLKGTCMVRIPPAGNVHGYWISDHHIDPRQPQIVVGDIFLKRVKPLGRRARTESR